MKEQIVHYSSYDLGKNSRRRRASSLHLGRSFCFPNSFNVRSMKQNPLVLLDPTSRTWICLLRKTDHRRRDAPPTCGSVHLSTSPSLHRYSCILGPSSVAELQLPAGSLLLQFAAEPLPPPRLSLHPARHPSPPAWPELLPARFLLHCLIALPLGIQSYNALMTPPAHDPIGHTHTHTHIPRAVSRWADSPTPPRKR